MSGYVQNQQQMANPTPTDTPVDPAATPVAYKRDQQNRLVPIDTPTVYTPPADNYNADKLLARFAGTPFASTPGLKDVLSAYVTPSSYSGYGGPNESWANAVASTINQYADTFTGMFKDKVGRPPTADDYNQFFNTVVKADAPWAAPADFTKAGQETSGFLSNYYTTAAQDEAKKKLQDLATGATAPGSAFDQWQQAYTGSIDTVDKSLQDYQSRIMEKIRPQLLTSLKTQGLLDTGALNQAFAGQASDMAATGANYIAGLRGQAAQDVASQKYNIMANPTNYAINNTMASVPNMINQGQTALGNVWNSYMQNQDYQHQLGLLNAQNANQPSLLQQYGGMILGGMAGGAGQRLAMGLK